MRLSWKSARRAALTAVVIVLASVCAARAQAPAFAKDIAGAKLVLLDACVHTPQLECAAPFQAALLQFLGGAAER